MLFVVVFPSILPESDGCKYISAPSCEVCVDFLWFVQFSRGLTFHTTIVRVHPQPPSRSSCRPAFSSWICCYRFSRLLNSWHPNWFATKWRKNVLFVLCHAIPFPLYEYYICKSFCSIKYPTFAGFSTVRLHNRICFCFSHCFSVCAKCRRNVLWFI